MRPRSGRGRARARGSGWAAPGRPGVPGGRAGPRAGRGRPPPAPGAASAERDGPPPSLSRSRRAAPAAGGRTSRRRKEFKDGDWLCPSCGDHQFAKNAACRRCGAPREGPGGALTGRAPPAGRTVTAADFPRELGSTPARGKALAQLHRVGLDGAYVGLVSGPVEAEAVDATKPDHKAGKGKQQVWQVKKEQPAWAARLEGQELDARDTRFATQLVAGVTRWRRRLDFFIDQFTGDYDLDPEVRDILRMGVFELLVLKKPAHIMSDHVELTKFCSNVGASKLVNGVLRNVARDQEDGALPQPPKPSSLETDGDRYLLADALGIQFSHPTWMVTRWMRRFGPKDTLRLLSHNNRPPTFGLRVNARRGQTVPGLVDVLKREGVDAVPSEHLPQDFVKVKAGLQVALRGGLLRDGACAVQDESAGLVVALLDPQPGDRVLDACAAPGGKSLFAASRVGDAGGVLCLDISKARLGALRNQAERLGLGAVVRTHATDFRAFPDEVAAQGRELRFDRVLIDAPCSGLGVLAKRADLRWRRTPREIEELKELQAELLRAAVGFVKPGGHLVYSTCSIEPDENEAIVEAFLADHPAFALVEAAGVVNPSLTRCDGKYLGTLPFTHGGMDGAFGALLRKVG